MMFLSGVLPLKRMYQPLFTISSTLFFTLHTYHAGKELQCFFDDQVQSLRRRSKITQALSSRQM